MIETEGVIYERAEVSNRDILQGRLQEYQNWRVQMQMKYGDDWEKVLPAEDRFVWKDFTEGELSNYGRYLEMREQAGLSKEDLLESFEMVDLPNPLDFFADGFINLRNEIKKAFLGTSDDVLNKAMKDLSFDLFEIVAVFSLAFTAAQDMGKLIVSSLQQDSTADESGGFVRSNRKFDELVKEGVKVVVGILQRMDECYTLDPVEQLGDKDIVPRFLQEPARTQVMLQSV